MNGFRLHAVGEFFDVDRYLNQYQIDYDSVWYRNEKKRYSNSGFVKYLGNEFNLDICKQEKIAYRYIQKNQKALEALVKWQNVETVILGLSPELEVDYSLCGVCFSFASNTVALAGEIGLQLAFYVRVSILEDYDDNLPFAEER